MGKYSLIALLYIALFTSQCVNCKEAKDSKYSYKGRVRVTMQIAGKRNSKISGRQNIIPPYDLLIIDKFIIEPRLNDVLVNSISKRVDTLGYFFVDLKQQKFYLFDDFSPKATLIKSDDLRNKEIGLTFYCPGVDFFEGAEILKSNKTANRKQIQATKISSGKRYNLSAYLSQDPERFPLQLSQRLVDMGQGWFINKLVQTNPNSGDSIIIESNFIKQEFTNQQTNVVNAWLKKISTHEIGD